MPITEFLLYTSVFIFIGVFAGIMSGILGIGGGIIVVPGLAFIFAYTKIIPEADIMQVAAGTSLAVMIFTSQAALRAHYRLGEILWSYYHKLWPGLGAGTFVSAIVAQFIPTDWLEIFFAIFLFCIAIKMFIDNEEKHKEHHPPAWRNHLISFLIGAQSGLLGIGGGVLIIPYLTYCGVSARKIAPVSNLCTLTVALIGAAVFMVTGWKEMGPVPYSLGYIYWPAVLAVAIPSSLAAPLGAKLNYIVPVRQLKYVFIVILLVTAIKLLF